MATYTVNLSGPVSDYLEKTQRLTGRPVPDVVAALIDDWYDRIKDGPEVNQDLLDKINEGVRQWEAGDTEPFTIDDIIAESYRRSAERERATRPAGATG